MRSVVQRSGWTWSQRRSESADVVAVFLLAFLPSFFFFFFSFALLWLMLHRDKQGFSIYTVN